MAASKIASGTSSLVGWQDLTPSGGTPAAILFLIARTNPGDANRFNVWGEVSFGVFAQQGWTSGAAYNTRQQVKYGRLFDGGAASADPGLINIDPDSSGYLSCSVNFWFPGIDWELWAYSAD